MSDVNLLFLIVLATIGLFVWNRLPLVVVAMGSALALYVTGILALDQVFRGFGATGGCRSGTHCRSCPALR